ncbi:MAG: hypothetical protein V1663_03420 [archaeon]
MKDMKINYSVLITLFFIITLVLSLNVHSMNINQDLTLVGEEADNSKTGKSLMQIQRIEQKFESSIVDSINSKHPALADSGNTGNNYLIKMYEEYNDITNSKMMKLISYSNDGQIQDLNINAYPNATYPSIEYWGYLPNNQEHAFYGTWVTPKESGSGGNIWLQYYYKNITNSSNDRYWAAYWPWINQNWTNMTMNDIAVDNSSDDWAWGFQSVVISHINSSFGPLLVNAPTIFYQFNSTGYSWLRYYVSYNNCNSTSSDIDHTQQKTYSVYDWYWYNTTTNKWKLLIIKADWYSMTHGNGYPYMSAYAWSYTTPQLNIRNPVVAAEDNKLLILAEVYNSTNPSETDIIAFRNTTTGSINSLATSTVAASDDRESNPQLKHISGNTFVATFVKNNHLYKTITQDAGITWSTPELMSGSNNVVDEQRTSSISDLGSKVIWEYLSGNTVQIRWLPFYGLNYPDVWVDVNPIGSTIFPPSGGRLNYNIAAGNYETTPSRVDIWVNIILPSGLVYGPILGPINNFQLPAGSSINRDRTFTVPRGAPAGTYTLRAYLGDYDAVNATIYAQDSFNFIKLGILQESANIDNISEDINEETKDFEFSLSETENDF